MSEPARPDHGQVEPLAALVAAIAVVAAVSMYAGVLDRSSDRPDRDVARPTLDRVRAALTDGAVALPGRLERASRRGPRGYAVNATLTTDGTRRAVGANPPASVDSARTRVGVRVGPGRVRSGTLSVAIWRSPGTEAVEA